MRTRIAPDDLFPGDSFLANVIGSFLRARPGVNRRRVRPAADQLANPALTAAPPRATAMRCPPGMPFMTLGRCWIVNPNPILQYDMLLLLTHIW